MLEGLRSKLFEAYLEQIVSISPADAKSHYLLAKIYYRQADYPQAFAACRRSLLFQPDSTKARKLMAQIYIKMGNQQAAGRILDELGITIDEFSKEL